MGGGVAGWAPGAAVEEPVSSGLALGLMVHGFLSAVEGFFSSGLGIGGGSGGVAEGCTMGASGISASWDGWVCDGCACWVWVAGGCAQLSLGLRLKARQPTTRRPAISRDVVRFLSGADISSLTLAFRFPQKPQYGK